MTDAGTLAAQVQIGRYRLSSLELWGGRTVQIGQTLTTEDLPELSKARAEAGQFFGDDAQTARISLNVFVLEGRVGRACQAAKQRMEECGVVSMHFVIRRTALGWSAVGLEPLT